MSSSSPKKQTAVAAQQDFGMLPRIMNASIAGIIGVTCVFPLDLAQDEMAKYASFDKWRTKALQNADCFVKTFRNEGLLGMYKGSSVNLLLITPEKAIKLVANDGFRYLLKNQDGTFPIWKQVLAGASAGMCQIVITTPMELLKITLQDQGRVASASAAAKAAADGGKTVAAEVAKPPSATQIAIKLFKEKGFKGFFQGGTATLVRDVSFSAIYFPLFAFLNSQGTDPKTNSTPFYHTFFSGMLAASIGAYVATPLDVIKTRIQTTQKAPGEMQYNGMLDTFFKIVKHESPAALFKGAVARVCVVAPLFGIAQMFYYLGVAESLLGMNKMKAI